MGYQITILPVNSRELGLQFKYDAVLAERARGLPQRRWDREKKLWAFMPSPANLEYIKHWMPSAVWHPDCAKFNQEVQERKKERDKIRQLKQTGDIDLSILDNVPFRLPPKKHQKIALALGRDLEAFAYLMDQGTGKTKTIIDDAAHNFRMKRINALLVIAPNSVKTNWVSPDAPGSEPDEITKHMAPDIPWVAGCWMSKQTKAQKKRFEQFEITDRQTEPWDYLRILVVNIETIGNERCNKYVEQFVRDHNTMIAIDESTRIKHRTSIRSKACHKLAPLAKIRRIASGTPVIKSPLHAYSQFYFLDPEIIGYSNYKSFEAHYGILGGYEGREVLSYQNLEELQVKLDSASYRVLKEDCLDLEPKIYQRRNVAMSQDQKHAYETLREEAIYEFENAETKESNWVEANIVLTKYLRMQQITSGFIPILGPDGIQTGYQPFQEMPPKIAEALDIIDECQGKVIVWCKFRPEVDLLCKALKKAKIPFVEFHGGISESDCIKNRQKFQEGNDDIKVFVGTMSKGGIGITLTAASTVIYLSNSFDTEARVQSEDRSHRIGTVHSVAYIDLVVPGTVDVKIIQCLRDDRRISDMVMKDGIRKWI